MSDSQNIIPEGLCQCGCGRKTSIAKRTTSRNGWFKGKPVRYISGHNPITNHRGLKGKENPKWKGGTHISRGYKYIKLPEHPCATKAGYVLEHRIVMEIILDRILKPHEVVHHINGNKEDNHPANLMLCKSHGHHSHTEHPKPRCIKTGRFLKSTES